MPPTGKYKINYVAKDGKQFHNNNDADLFIFRGSPDLIFSWHDNGTSAAAITSDVTTVPRASKENEPDDDDDTSSVASAENMLQRSPLVQINGIPTYEKTGELIANLHVLAVQRVLKMLKHQNSHVTKPSIGILLDKIYGVIKCTVIFPIYDGFNDTCEVDPQLDISSSLRGALEVDSLC